MVFVVSQVPRSEAPGAPRHYGRIKGGAAGTRLHISITTFFACSCSEGHPSASPCSGSAGHPFLSTRDSAGPCTGGLPSQLPRHQAVHCSAGHPSQSPQYCTGGHPSQSSLHRTGFYMRSLLQRTEVMMTRPRKAVCSIQDTGARGAANAGRRSHSLTERRRGFGQVRGSWFATLESKCDSRMGHPRQMSGPEGHANTLSFRGLKPPAPSGIFNLQTQVPKCEGPGAPRL